MSGARVGRSTPVNEHFREQQDNGFHAQAHAPQQIQLNIDKGLGKQFFIVLWLTAFVAAISISAVIIGGMVMWDAHRVTRQHVKVLEYDLMDLRSKTGNAHENTEQ